MSSKTVAFPPRGDRNTSAVPYSGVVTDPESLENDRAVHGYKVPLAQMINRKAVARLVFHDGTYVDGHVHSFDEDTITLKHSGDEWPTTYFVNGLRSFTRYE